jgi:lambda family phage tail tape measure protein
LSDTNNQTIKYSVDASGVEAGVSKLVSAQTRVNQAMADSADRAAKLNKAEQALADQGLSATTRQLNAVIAQMDRMRDAMTKTQVERFSDKLGKLGLGNAFSSEIVELKELERAAKGAHSGMAGVSRELLVMSHEVITGNFSRLGGSAMVLGERIDIMGKLAVVGGLATVGALAAAGAAVYEFVEGIQAANSRVGAFDAAMNDTMGYARQTRESIQELAEGLSQRFGVSVGQATDDLNQLVATGKVTADIFPQVGTVATAMAKSTGEAFDKVLASLLRQQEDVKKAAAEYQASHHSMADAQMSLIDSLTKAGQAHAAYTVLIQQQLADVERATKESTSHLAGFWDDATAGIQRYFRALAGKSTDLDVLNDLKAKQSAQQSGRTTGDYTDYGPLIAAQQKLVDGNLAEQKQASENAAQNALLADSLTTVQAEYERTLSPQQRLTEAITRDNAVIDTRIKLLSQAGKLTDSSRAQLEAQRKQMIGFDTDRITPAHKSDKSRVAAINADTQSSLEMRRLIEQQEQQKLQYQRELGLVSERQYYAQLHQIQVDALSQEVADAQKRADLLKGSKDTAAYKRAQGSLAVLQQQRAGLDQTYSQQTGTLDFNEGLANRREQAGNAFQLTQLRASMTATDDTRDMSAVQKQQYDELFQIRQQYAQKVEQLYEQYGLDPASDQKEYADKLKNAQEYYAQLLQTRQQAIDADNTRLNSYTDQMRSAISDVSNAGITNAQATAEAFTTAWQDSSNALNEFLTTGKGSFDQFTAAILADLAKIALQQAEMVIFNSIVGGVGSLFGLGGAGNFTGGATPATSGDPFIGAGAFATGGHISGPGSGTSDSIPAMLSNGEYVINAAATKKYRGLLDSINTGKLSHFATGGAVGSVQSSAVSSSSGSSPVSIVVHNSGGGNMTDQDAKDLHKLVQSFVDQRMSYQMRRQGGYAQQIRYGQI